MSKMLSATALIMMNVKYRMIEFKAVEKEPQPERIGVARNALFDADGSRYSADRISFGHVNAELIRKENIYRNGCFIGMKTGEMMKQLTVSDCTILNAR